jgi:hypothetical protein
MSPRRQTRRESCRSVSVPWLDVVRDVIEVAERRDPRLAPLLMLEALTGMRRGEPRTFQWSDLDLDSGIIHVTRSIVVVPDWLAENATKTYRGRSVALDPVGFALLSQHRARSAQNCVGTIRHMETELASKYTALIQGGSTKMGTLVLTTERLLFFDQKFASNAGFGVLGLVGGALQKRHEEGGPLLQVSLDAVTGAGREKKLLNKDRMRLTSKTGVLLFNDGWSHLGSALRDTLADRGANLTRGDDESWTVG